MGLALRSVLVILLSYVLLTTYRFAQPPAPASLKPRIFVLGLSKTGTTSIGDALEKLGYRRLGWRDVRSRHTVHSWANGNLEPLVALTRYYDAFEDLPWPQVYREMAELYPDAKFLLSLRRDEQTWLRSMRVHVGRGRWLGYKYFYGAGTVDGNEDVVLQSYRNHTRDVREYFADQPGRYAEMSIDDGDVNWDVLCRIAQCPGSKAPTVGFPQSNTAASWNLGVVFNHLIWYYGWVITRAEEWATQYYYHSGKTLLRPVLSASWSSFDFVERACTELYFQAFSPLLLPPVAGTA